MIARWALSLALALPSVTSAVAQQAPAGIEDLRPQGQRIDGLGVEELPIGIVPKTGAPKDDDAIAISEEIFGPRVPVDAAYGAFQRGFFLTALSLALPRAGRNDAAAQTLIAEIYAKGLGVAENLPAASSWYGLASANGDPVATFELAMMYQEGRGVPRNRQRAAELFGKAADQGSIAAKYNLGLLYVEGAYVEPNVVKAAGLIKEAADAGLAEAQYDYGTMLIEGAGLRPDVRVGARQIGLAAEQGLAAAQVDYATMLYLGQGIAPDREAAVKWYARAAGGGNAVAQNRYAKLLAAGEGTDLDLEAAAMWRALARRQGLADPLLDKLLISIPLDELARAEERARFWPSEPPLAEEPAPLPPMSPPPVGAGLLTPGT